MAGKRNSKKIQPPAKSQSSSAKKEKTPSTWDLPPSLSRKITPWELETSSVPGYCSNVTSRSAREKARFKISKASLEDESINEQSISQLISTRLHPNSSSQEFWGVSLSQPIEAPRKKQTGATLKNFTQMRPSVTVQSLNVVSKETRPIQLALTKTQQPPNAVNSRTSDLLKLPLELREMVYGHLIQDSDPLKMRPDWQTVERHPHCRHSIFYTCKQIKEEATAFFILSSIVHVVFNCRYLGSFFCLRRDKMYLDPHHISSYRRIIIEFEEDCMDSFWLEMATRSIKILVEAKPVIAWLSLITPERLWKVPKSTSAPGIPSSEVPFADFLSYSGDFMVLLRRLAPSTFNIIVRKDTTLQLFASLDLRYLQANRNKRALLALPEKSEFLSKNEAEIDAELKSLKAKCEKLYSANG